MWRVALVLVAVLMVGCEAADTESGPKTAVPATPNRKLEKDMHTIDRSATERQYTVALDSLAPKCMDGRQAAGDAAAALRSLLKKDYNIDIPLLKVLNEMDKSIPAGQRMNCRDVATALGLILINQR